MAGHQGFSLATMNVTLSYFNTLVVDSLSIWCIYPSIWDLSDRSEICSHVGYIHVCRADQKKRKSQRY